jgi:hypothetical protein
MGFYPTLAVPHSRELTEAAKKAGVIKQNDKISEAADPHISDIEESYVELTDEEDDNDTILG